MARFQISLTVQGEADANRLLYWGIPSLLAPGNLEVLNSGENEARLLVHTTTADRWMVATAAFQRLREVLSGIEIRTDDEESGFPLCCRCLRETFQAAEDWDASLVILPPNMVWAERSFWILPAALEQGHRAVHVPLVRVFEPAMTEVLAPLGRNGKIAIDHRHLVELALPRLHPLVGQGHFWRNEDKLPVYYGHKNAEVALALIDEFHPSQLYWRVSDRMLLAHSFNLHPLLIQPIVADVQIESLVLHPDEVAWAAVPDVERHFVVRDSDTLIGFELAPPMPASYTASSRVPRTVAAARELVNQPRTPLKSALARKAIRIHSGNSLITPESYDLVATEAAAADLISEILGDRP